jgi:hypothetical protein
MSNIGPVGGDVNYTPIQKRLSPAPLPKETSSVTTPDTIVSKSFINRDQFIPADIANSALPPKTEKNSNVDNAWFAVKAEATDANVLSPINANVLPPINANVLPLALNMNPDARIELIESSPEGKESVRAGLMKHIGPDTDTSRVLGIMDNLA